MAWFYWTKLPLKPVRLLPFSFIMVNYPILSLNYHILYFQMYFQYFSFLPKYPNNISKRVTFCNFWNRTSHRNDWFRFLELFSIIHQAHSVRSSVKMYFFVRTYFRTVYSVMTHLLCLFSIVFGSSVISTDIQNDIITNLSG